MANLIQDHLYRVALDSERKFEYISAKNKDDLMLFLANEFTGKRELYGVKEVGHDGSLTTVTIITDPKYQKLVQDRLEALNAEKKPLDKQISEAEEKRSEASYKAPSERKEPQR